VSLLECTHLYFKVSELSSPQITIKHCNPIKSLPCSNNPSLQYPRSGCTQGQPQPQPVVKIAHYRYIKFRPPEAQEALKFIIWRHICHKTSTGPHRENLLAPGDFRDFRWLWWTLSLLTHQHQWRYLPTYRTPITGHITTLHPCFIRTF